MAISLFPTEDDDREYEVFKKRGELMDILIKNDYGDISREECEVRKNEIKREIIDLINEEVDLRVESQDSMRDPAFSWEGDGEKKSDYDVGHEKLKIERAMNKIFFYIDTLHKNNDVEGLKVVKSYINIYTIEMVSNYIMYIDRSDEMKEGEIHYFLKLEDMDGLYDWYLAIQNLDVEGEGK